MKFLVTLTAAGGRTFPDFQPYIVAEEKRVWELYSAGVIREMYLQLEPMRVSLIFEGADRAEVERQVGTLPMVQAQMLRIDIAELGPWKLLESLFEEQHKLWK
jgi:hypothetical protein